MVEGRRDLEGMRKVEIRREVEGRGEREEGGRRVEEGRKEVGVQGRREAERRWGFKGGEGTREERGRREEVVDWNFDKKSKFVLDVSRSPLCNMHARIHE